MTSLPVWSLPLNVSSLLSQFTATIANCRDMCELQADCRRHFASDKSVLSLILVADVLCCLLWSISRFANW